MGKNDVPGKTSPLKMENVDEDTILETSVRGHRPTIRHVLALEEEMNLWRGAAVALALTAAFSFFVIIYQHCAFEELKDTLATYEAENEVHSEAHESR